MGSFRTICSGLLVSVSLLACSSSDHPPALATQTYPLPECPTLASRPCDTREPDCQQRLLQLAACVYGVENAPDVPIRVVSEAQLIDELTAPTPGAGGASSDGASTDDMAHVERALVDLQLLEPGDLTDNTGSTADLVARVDGVYQDAEHGIALVDRGLPKDSAESSAVLVHELVHAIQDARYDLQDWLQQYGRDVDGALAARSVTEGQATYAQFRVVYAMSGYDLRRTDLASELEAFRERLFTSAHADASPYLASLTTFPYAAGVGAAERRWSAGGLHFAESQFDEPPLSTLQAFSESYGLELDPPEPLELTAPNDDDYKLLEQTVLGAFMLELFLHKQGLSRQLCRALALDWQADKLWIYSGPEQRTAFLWEVQLRSDDFNRLDSLAAAPSGVVREHAGRRLFVAGSEAPPEFVLTAGRDYLSEAP